MAKNLIYKPGYELSVVCDSPTTPASGDPVRYGNLTGLALTDKGEGGNPTTETTVDFGPFIADLSVKAVDADGDSAVAVGDGIWYVDADTPKLSKKASGYFFGFALEAITSGATDTINVMHVPAPGSGTMAAGSIGSTQLAASAVTASKVAANAIGTTKIIAANVTEAKVEEGAAGAGLSGLVAKFVANANVTGGVPVVHVIDVADAAGNTDVTFTHKTKILLAGFKNTGVAAHATTDTIGLQNVTDAITPVTPKTATVNKVVLFDSLIEAYDTIAAGTKLRVVAAKGAGALNVACTVFVIGIRVA
jgi:hypothetical protein